MASRSSAYTRYEGSPGCGGCIISAMQIWPLRLGHRLRGGRVGCGHAHERAGTPRAREPRSRAPPTPDGRQLVKLVLDRLRKVDALKVAAPPAQRAAEGGRAGARARQAAIHPRATHLPHSPKKPLLIEFMLTSATPCATSGSISRSTCTRCARTQGRRRPCTTPPCLWCARSPHLFEAVERLALGVHVGLVHLVRDQHQRLLQHRAGGMLGHASRISSRARPPHLFAKPHELLLVGPL